jgi:hypothetical protein
MVIIKSKLTGKFLRQHSGSVNNFSRRMRGKMNKDREFLAGLPEDPKGYNYWRDTPSDRQKAINRETHNRMYDAEALEARRFANPGTAMTSIGKFNRFEDGPKHRKGRGTTFGTYSLPGHLEIHEIVAGNLCLVNPDDSEETKRKKEKECA